MVNEPSVLEPLKFYCRRKRSFIFGFIFFWTIANNSLSCNTFRPGFTRINLPYFLDDATLEFILEAVRLVAEEGWRLLPQYMFNPETGEWRQVNFQVIHFILKCQVGK